MWKKLKAWLAWIVSRLIDSFIRLVLFAAMALVMVLACVYIIDYAYEKGQQPCAPTYKYQAFIERKLWHSGEEKDRLYLVRMEGIQTEARRSSERLLRPSSTSRCRTDCA